MSTSMDKLTTVFYATKTLIFFWIEKIFNLTIPIKQTSEKKKYFPFLFLFKINMFYHLYGFFGGFMMDNFYMPKMTILLESNKKHFITTIKHCSAKDFYRTIKYLETDTLKYERVLCSPTVKKIEIINDGTIIDITDNIKNVINHNSSVLFGELLDLLFVPYNSELVVHKFNFETFQLCPYMVSAKDCLDMEICDVLKKVDTFVA